MVDILEEILLGKEERYSLELKLLGEFKSPILCLTVNYPGPDKVNKISKLIFEEALKALVDFRFALTLRGENPAGPYLIGVLCEEAMKAKLKAVEIEDRHPLGRLFDIDIIDYPFKVISRRDLGFTGRRCIVCGGEAERCIIERRHPLREVLTEIERVVRDYVKG